MYYKNIINSNFSSGNIDKNYSTLIKNYLLINFLKEKITEILEKKLSHIKTPITLSIIGCVVNGPGEAALTDIGVTGGGKNSNMLYLKGVQTEKLSNQEIITKVVDLVEKKAFEIDKNKK